MTPTGTPTLPDTERLAFILRVMAFAWHNDINDLLWLPEGEPHVNCSDTFVWGGADSEPITPENVELFEATVKECRTIGLHAWGFAETLFCARARKMRPMRLWYVRVLLREPSPENDKLVELFNACRSERDPKSEG